jgi:hypothetical protein
MNLLGKLPCTERAAVRRQGWAYPRESRGSTVLPDIGARNTVRLGGHPQDRNVAMDSTGEMLLFLLSDGVLREGKGLLGFE